MNYSAVLVANKCMARATSPVHRFDGWLPPGSVVAVKAFIEQDQIAPIPVFPKLCGSTVSWPPTVLASYKDGNSDQYVFGKFLCIFDEASN
jgi:hypothetical protein